MKNSFMKVTSFLFLLLLQSGSNTLGSSYKHVEEPPDLLQYRDGDVIIGGLFPVHLMGGGHKCSNLFNFGVEAVETFNMIIDQVNSNDSILPGVKLGSIMVDTCGIDTYALKRVVADFLPYVSGLTRSIAVDAQNNTKPLFAGVVGGAISTVSIQVAKLLQVFSIPQVSYWSTHPDLSNKERFKYFFRTVPSDLYEVKAIVTYVKSKGWNYISVVYMDSFYGVRALEEITELGEEMGICVAVSQAIIHTAVASDYRKIINELLKKKKSRVVVLFSGQIRASGVIKAAESIPEASGYFHWIASDGWAGYLPRGGDKSYENSIDGTIGFNPQTTPIANFDEYFSNITLLDRQNSSRNPWFPSYISQRNNCSIEFVDSVQKDGTILRRCSPEEHVDPKTFTHPYNIQNVADAVLSFVYALDAYHKVTCKGKSGICQEISSMRGTNQLGAELYEYMRNLTFKGINGENFEFDVNQDGPANYDIYNYQKNTDVESGEELLKWIHVGDFIVDSFEWKKKVIQKINRTDSLCSLPCAKNQATLMGATICCWNCQTCQKREYVQNKSACVRCPDGQKPNDNKDGCIDILIEYMDYHKTYGIVSLTVGFIGIMFTIAVFIIYVRQRNSPIVKASGRELCFFVQFGVFFTLTNSIAIVASPSLASCTAARLILSFGPTFMYAGILTKTTRVVIIFRSKILSSNMKLFLRPKSQIALAFLTVALQIFVVAIWFSTNQPESHVFYPDDETAFLACSHLVDIPILVGLMYPMLLILACTVFATVNRNVPTGFNETHLIGFTMYTTCVIWLAFLPIFIINTSSYDLKLTTVSICLSLSAFTVILCLFGPRCHTILFHPEENTTKSMMSIPIRPTFQPSTRFGQLPEAAATNNLPRRSNKIQPEQ